MSYKIGFIGCGNMGGALVTAAAKKVAGNEIAVCDYDPKKAEAFATAYGATVLTGEELVQQAEFVVLGVKPQVMYAPATAYMTVLLVLCTCSVYGICLID